MTTPRDQPSPALSRVLERLENVRRSGDGGYVVAPPICRPRNRRKGTSPRSPVENLLRQERKVCHD